MTQQHNLITKRSWTWSDLGTELSAFLLGDIGLVGGLGAAGYLSGGATGAAGALAAIGFSPVGLALLAAGLGYGAYSVFSVADDNLDDLISRIEALDYEGTPAEGDVKKWIQDLEGFRAHISAPVTASDPKERAMLMGSKVAGLQKVMDYLKMMRKTFPTLIEPHLKDWGFDPGDFKYSLGENISALQSQLSELRKAANHATAKVMKDNPKLYMNLAQSILKLDEQITKIWGAPEYTPKESKLVELAKRTLQNKADMYELEQNRAEMITLKRDLGGLLEQAKRKSTKRSSTQYPLSKRAVSLPEKPGAQTQTPAPAEQQKRQQKGRRSVVRKMPVVENMQRYINHIKVAAQLSDVPYVSEDGVYGPGTAKALHTLLQSFPKTTQYLQIQGMPIDKIADHRFMNSPSGIRFINLAAVTLRDFVKELTRSDEEPEESKKQLSKREKKDKQEEPSGPGVGAGACNIDKLHPTPKDVLNCLKTTYGYRGASRVNLYDYMRSKGMNHDDMLRLIQRLFGGRAPRVWAPELILREVG